jgi:chromate transporter
LLSVVSFGGGAAIVPQMHADVVERMHWIDSAQFSHFVALATLAPGPLLNIAALIGYTVAGIPGAIVASAALYAPAACIMYVIGRLWQRFAGHPWRERLALGLGPVVLGLFWAGVVAVGKGAIDGSATLGIAVAVTALALFTKVNQALLVAGAGAVALVVFR